MTGAYDYVVIGAGIVGITIARELKFRNPALRIAILEKESAPGKHSSGRNSGVLHSGIYYPPDTLKAKVCSQGAREMADYCQNNGLPLAQLGKILIPTREADLPQLMLLEQRAQANQIQVERLDAQALKTIEPEANSKFGRALWVPSTIVGDAKKVVAKLTQDVDALGIELRCGVHIQAVDVKTRAVRLSDGNNLSYGHVINAAGLHADTIAHQFSAGQHYVLLPFKGIYWKLDPAAHYQIRHLIYPVPDLRVPFLGVHTTTAIDGTVYLGPTAVPAFGRENYMGLQDVSFSEGARIIAALTKQFVGGQDGFRRLVWQEGARYIKPCFVEAARAILPRLQAKHLLPCDKVGIRAQMLNRSTGRLVTDFVVERGVDSTHVLNAISPAWTSAFPFARFVVDEYLEI